MPATSPRSIVPIRPRRGWCIGCPFAGASRLAAAVSLLAPIVAVGGAAEGETPELTMVEKVQLVLLPTTVTNARGKPVRGLVREDFRLYENGVARTIDLFATEEHSPVAVAFLLDVSGSMQLGDRLGEAKRAIHRIVGALDPDDRVGLICFADGMVEWISEFGDDRGAFLERLDVQRAAGRTALYDALAASPHLVDGQGRGRKAIILITDGVDNASDITRLRATWMARRVAVPIYTLGFLPMRERLLPYRAREALRVVGRFSTETGGSVFPVHDVRDLDRATRQIQRELRFQYVIGFYPPDRPGDVRFRALKVVIGRKGLRLRTRRGYYPTP